MTDTAELTNIDSLVDMDIAPQCEHEYHNVEQWHGGPAAYLITRFELCHFESSTILLCKKGWDTAEHGLACDVCETIYNRNAAWKIIEAL
jgi:hypothetical protein